jgi:hypothetical protein
VIIKNLNTRHFKMVKIILMTCGGFALAFLGCALSLSGQKEIGLLLAVGGVAMFLTGLGR